MNFKLLAKEPLALVDHEHVVYLDEESGVGISSFDENHSHQLTYVPEVPAQEAQYDEMGNEIAPAQEAQPSRWDQSPGPDGHRHPISKIPTKITQTVEDEGEVLASRRALFHAALENEGDSIEAGRQDEEFRHGEQWNPEERQRLERLQRAAVTFNYQGKNADELGGHQRSERTDFDFKPVGGGDQRVADMLDIVVKNITEQCFYSQAESDVFEDAITPGRGWFNAYIDVSRDLRGEIKIERFPWDDIVCGPHQKKDLSDCEHLHKTKMYSLAKIKQDWPEKADEIEKDLEAYSGFNDPHTQHQTEQYAQSSHRTPVILMTQSGPNWEMVDTLRKEYRVTETWERIYVSGTCVALPAYECYENADNWEPVYLRKAKTIPGARIVSRPTSKFRITRWAGNVVLSDEFPADLPVDDFFAVPVYCYKWRKGFYGKIRNTKDAQREINHRHSQAIDIGNKAVFSARYYDQTTFVDQEEENRFREFGTSPGGVYKLGTITNKPEKEEPARFPNEIVQLLQLGQSALQDLMSIAADPPGANTSAAAIMQRNESKMVGNKFIFDNLSISKTKLGRLILAMIQKYYKPDRILEILDEHMDDDQLQVGDKPITEWTREELEEILEKADLAKIDVVVTEAKWSPTARLATSIMLSEMIQAGMQIPPQVPVKYLDIPDSEKKSILADIQAQQAAASSAAQQTADGEIVKTLIAQGLVPPQIKQQYGLDQSSQGIQPDQAGQEMLDTQSVDSPLAQ